MSLMRLSCLIFKPAQDGGHTIIARVIRLYALTHARASYAHYLNGYFNDKIRLFPDQTKKEYPSNLIIIIDDKSREFKFSFPDVNDNICLVVKQHEAMLYVDGPRVYHELSRKFYWSNMINQIKMICKPCEPCQTAKVR